MEAARMMVFLEVVISNTTRRIFMSQKKTNSISGEMKVSENPIFQRVRSA